MSRRTTSAGALAVTASLLAAVPAAAGGLTVTVPGDYATIQEAVDAVQNDLDPGEVIVESDGSFDEAVLIEQSVTVSAGAGFSPTIEPIGSMSGPLRIIATQDEDTDVRIVGLTVRWTADGGSMVLLRNDSDLEALTVVFEQVVIEGQGVDEGIAAASGEGAVSLLMSESAVEIVGDDDGAPACLRLEAAGFDVGALVAASTFRFARAEGIRLRGGLDGDTATLLAFSNVFEGFESGGFPGRTGIRMLGLNAPTGDLSSAEALLLSNLFVGTTVAVDAAGTRQHEIELTANNNTVVGAAFRGVALTAAQQSTLTANLANNVVVGTLGTSDGAEGPVAGSGIVATEGPEATIVLVNGHNLLFDNAGGDYGGIAMPGPGDVFADPLFVAPAQGNYRLGAGSPAIDAGDDEPPGTVGDVDLDREPRIVDGDRDGVATVDIGAYEAPQPSVLEVPTLSTAALLAFAVLLAAAAAWRLRRRPV